MAQGLTVFILSEGGGKFNNLKENKHVSFSIAEAYDLKKDFFGDKGLQAWGKAKVDSLRQNPEPYREAGRKMNIKKVARAQTPADLSSVLHYKIIEITPAKKRFCNVCEAIFIATWTNNGLFTRS